MQTLAAAFDAMKLAALGGNLHFALEPGVANPFLGRDGDGAVKYSALHCQAANATLNSLPVAKGVGLLYPQPNPPRHNRPISSLQWPELSATFCDLRLSKSVALVPFAQPEPEA